MPTGTSFFDRTDTDPIAIVGKLAEEHEWDFDLIADNQIAMAIEGTWITYSVTVAWSPSEEQLRLICAFAFTAQKKRHPALFELMARANDACWTGAFVLWPAQELLAYKYSLNLTGGAELKEEQISDMIRAAVAACERFYPAFQLVGFGKDKPLDAMAVAMHETYGRA